MKEIIPRSILIGSQFSVLFKFQFLLPTEGF